MDLDPQSSLSEILFNGNNLNNDHNADLLKCTENKDKDNHSHSLKCVKDNKTLNYIFDLSLIKIKKYPSIKLEFNEDIIQHYKKGNFDFIISSLFYVNGGLDDLIIKMNDSLEYLTILKDYLDKISRKYDYIFIDCPPSNNIITRATFLMSDYFVIPTIFDKISTDGVAHYIKTVEDTYNNYCINSENGLLDKHFFGEKPKLIKIFYTLKREQVNYNDVSNSLTDTIRYLNVENIISKKEINNYIDTAKGAAKGEVSEDYRELSNELLQELEKLQELENKSENL